MILYNIFIIFAIYLYVFIFYVFVYQYGKVQSFRAVLELAISSVTPVVPEQESSLMSVLSVKHTGATVGHLKLLGRLERIREQICSVCSAALEAFGAAHTWSAPIQRGWLLAV